MKTRTVPHRVDRLRADATRAEVVAQIDAASNDLRRAATLFAASRQRRSALYDGSKPALEEDIMVLAYETTMQAAARRYAYWVDALAVVWTS